MNNITVNLNKEWIIKTLKEKLDLFGDAIIKKNNEIKELKEKLMHCNQARVELARAYAKEIKVLT